MTLHDAWDDLRSYAARLVRASSDEVRTVKGALRGATTQPLPQLRIEVRTYRAWTQAEAMVPYADEAATFRANGWQQQGQAIWTPPQTWRMFVTPLLLIVGGYIAGGDYGRFLFQADYALAGALIGAVIGLTYILLEPPKGTLTVTFQRLEAQPSQ